MAGYFNNVFGDIVENFEALGEEAMERPPAQPPRRGGGLSTAPPPTPIEEAGDGFDWSRFGGDMLNRLGSGILIGGGNQAAGIRKRENFLEARRYEDQLAEQQEKEQRLASSLQGLEGEIGSQQWINGAMRIFLNEGEMEAVLKLSKNLVNAQDFMPKPDFDEYTPESMAAYKKSGGDPSVLDPRDKEPTSAFAKPNIEDYTPESAAVYNKTLNPADLVEVEEQGGAYEASDYQVLQARDGTWQRVNKVTGEMTPVTGTPSAPMYDPAKIRPENDAFLKRTQGARTMIQQTQRILAAIDEAIRSGDPLSAETALKAYVQAIDDSVVRQAELEGAKDAYGIREAFRAKWALAQGKIDKGHLNILRNAAVALGETALPAMDTAISSYRSMYGKSPQYAPFIDDIVSYDQEWAYGEIKREITRRNQTPTGLPTWAVTKPVPTPIAPQGNATQGVHEGAMVHQDIQTQAPTMDQGDPNAEGEALLGGADPRGGSPDAEIPGVVWD